MDYIFLCNPSIPIAWRLLSAWCIIFPNIFFIWDIYFGRGAKFYKNPLQEVLLRTFGLTGMFSDDQSIERRMMGASANTKFVHVLYENIPQFFIQTFINLN